MTEVAKISGSAIAGKPRRTSPICAGFRPPFRTDSVVSWKSRRIDTRSDHSFAVDTASIRSAVCSSLLQRPCSTQSSAAASGCRTGGKPVHAAPFFRRGETSPQLTCVKIQLPGCDIFRRNHDFAGRCCRNVPGPHNRHTMQDRGGSRTAIQVAEHLRRLRSTRVLQSGEGSARPQPFRAEECMTAARSERRSSRLHQMSRPSRRRRHRHDDASTGFMPALAPVLVAVLAQKQSAER